MTRKNFWTVLILATLSLTANAANEAQSEDLNSDFDSLGGNRILLERAQALEPDKKMMIVQERTVSRRNRVEMAPEFSGTFGGDTYTRTRSVGMNLRFHFNPRVSVGMKYNYSFNQLTPEGEVLVDQAYQEFQNRPSRPTAAFPEVNYPKTEVMALANWYPIYGKMNMLDKGVAHFDWYLIGGYGQVQLATGATPSYTAGTGLGFWLNNHWSSRVEMRYQNYKAPYRSGEKNMDLAVASFQMGYLL